MARAKSESRREKMFDVAYLSAQGKSGVEIGRTLGIEPYHVSRLRKAAESEGLLVLPKPVQGPGWTQQMEDAARRRLGEESALLRELQEAEKLGLLCTPLSVHVIPAAHVTARDWARRLTHFGIAAAHYVQQLLLASRIVGVSWGGTLEAVVRGIEQLAPNRPSNRPPVWMVPVCGEPIEGLPYPLSASSLSARLAHSIDGVRGQALSLAPVPFMIPLDFHDRHSESRGSTHRPRKPLLNEVEVVKKLIERVPAYRRIIGSRLSPAEGPRSPLAGRLSMILTSVGLDGLPYGRGGDKFLKSCGLSPDQFRNVARADISGLLLPCPDHELSPQARQFLRRVADHWTGISFDNLAACAHRARRGQSYNPGVVVVAAGSGKAPVVLDCMTPRHSRSGLISHLIIDSDLEKELLRLVRSALRRKRS